ncbi:MAG: TonB-dependent receptor [Bacteroidetes bacterium]|nr:TonB-dependent receptor [Bacteroidota bacterium]
MKAIYLFLLMLIASILNAQNISQTIKGKVVDKETQSPLPGAAIVVLNSNPLIGAVSDIDGIFIIKNVPIGRYNLKISFISYEPVVINEVLVSSGKEIVLNTELIESVKTINEVVIKANKSQPLNSMATVSSRQFSVEETSRYAGGLDDPARLASSFAGVSGNLSTNGIVVRGNAPTGLLWRMEGVEIFSPSHFANVSSLGAGAITAISSQMLSNSDFYTGAFPSEYGNALSGVFDIKLRTGNNEKYENTLQLGIVGIDVSSEGPFVKGKQASFLFNYRFSTLTLLAPILPPEMGKLRYQDLSFKLNFPTKKMGTFSIWGIGAMDYQGRDAISDSSLWQSDVDKEQYNTDLFMSALGLNHKILINSKTYINTSITQTGNGLLLKGNEYNYNMSLIPTSYIENNKWKYTISSFINHKFNAKHTNKTGVIIDRLQYDMNIQNADSGQVALTSFVNAHGYSYLIQAFSQSKYNITNALILNIGIHSQLFALNNHYTIEPRIGVTWNFSPLQTLSIAYGLHSQLAPLDFYFVQQNSISGIIEPNKKLDFSEAHHLVISYEIKLNEHTHFKAEPYYQKLFDMPVIPNSYYSLQNLENTMYFNNTLVNKGKGRNIGIDLTFERFLNKGYYYLVTASIFDSKYWGGDGIERNTRFNNKCVINLLGGKEWKVGKSKNNILSLNGKLNLMGGEYMNPINIDATYMANEIVQDTLNAFTQRKPFAKVLSFSVSYRINKPKHTSIWALNFMNALFYKELNFYYFDKTSNSIKKDVNELVIPNISYKIEF